GKDGLLDISLAAGRRRTVMKAYAHRSPLQMGRLLYPDVSCPEMAYCYTAMLTGGLVQGDRLEQRISVEAGARAHVTTLAATKIYRMANNHASQRLQLRVAAGGVLEWWPDPVIPHRGARFVQDVTLSVADEGVLVYGDLLLPGRTGEQHAYAVYQSRITARRPDGTLLFVDTQALAPSPPGARPLHETLPPERGVIGSVFVLCPVAASDDLSSELRQAIRHWDTSEMLGGCTTLPAACGIMVRFLAVDGLAGRKAAAQVLHIMRQQLLGTPVPPMRKY
ncbi:MAG TPA: urease accessory protein UreD, partial [Chloroflexota bacterium]|nr:urease accessory protein UreD [Chloroflexota bacterium]